MQLTNKKIGLGFSFINDELGYQNFTYLYGDFSYTIQVSAKTKLAFGLKAGFTAYSVDQELLLAEPDDPAIFGINDRFSPNIGAGAFLHSNRWYVGLSAPRILNTDDVDGDIEALERVSYYLTGGYVFDISAMTKFKPAFLVKATNGAPISYDLTANFLFNEKFWLGAAYRFNENTGAFGALADFQVSPQLRLGYAYDHPISDIRPYSSGTHEILLMYEFKRSKRVKSPRYF